MQKLHDIDREYRHLERAIAALQWDQETYLPPEGVEERAEQLALLEGIAHQRLIEPETGRLLDEWGANTGLSALEQDFLRVMRRRYERAVKLPPELVTEAARAEGLSQAAWVQARQNNDFAAFLPHLKTMIGIARKKAEHWGFGSNGRSLYDGLLDIYEPGMGEAEIGALFVTLRNRLSALIKKIQKCTPPDTSFLRQAFSIEKQAAFNQKLMGYIGFDTRRGRLDTSAHPFTATLGSNDIRITTRYAADNLLSGVFSVIHESGHALYEMGFSPDLRGTCLADGASMAIHESQSRFWENVMGRSLPFWEGLFPLLHEFFPEQFTRTNIRQWYCAVNEVKPSLIRVDADEVSYSLHVILRFELEQQLIAGTLAPEELPAAWRTKTKEYLGIEVDASDPRSDADGVLQDVHWSMGAFGYFPSYVLGNLYGLQFTRKLRQDIPDFEQCIAAGKFDSIQNWLKENIYRWGCRLEPAELLRTVTGETLSAEPFLEYIEGKYGALYP